jgi:biotin transport system substrate-specific component
MTTKDSVLVALFAALTAALGMMPPVPMPFGVPITLQSMAPMLAGALLGARKGALSQILFLVLVFAGLPLLSGGRGGLGILLGPTAGFALSWVLIAALIGCFVHNPQAQKRWLPTALTCFTLAVILGAGLGVTWLSVYLETSWLEAGASCLIFLPGECIKSCLTAQVVVQVQKNFTPSSQNQPAKKLF